MSKVKIILDGDVIIHFAKGEMLGTLPTIFPSYDFIVLDTVYGEIHGDIKKQLDKQIDLLKNIGVVSFAPTGEQMKEYANLKKSLGKGESASLVYCRWNNDVIGSSNLRDIKEYCTQYDITYLTTFDFLYFAVKNKIITQKEACGFINKVKAKNSKLPSVQEFEKYVSQVSV